LTFTEEESFFLYDWQNYADARAEPGMPLNHGSDYAANCENNTSSG
jgi:hypothetical protein